METGLRGRRALVTGASKGLGYAVAAALAAEGCRVAISSRSDAHIRAAAESLGGEVVAMAADVSQPDECADLIDWATTALGGLDVLVVNAGGPPSGGIAGLDEAQWRHAFDLTLMSAVRLSQGCLPALRESGHGAILFLTSISVKQPIPNLVLSNSLRAGVIGFAKTLAGEAAPEVRVNSIATGWFATDRTTQLLSDGAARQGLPADEVLRQRAAQIPLGRMGRADELAAAAVFLCGDAASFITGATLSVDGGESRGLL